MEMVGSVLMAGGAATLEIGDGKLEIGNLAAGNASARKVSGAMAT